MFKLMAKKLITIFSAHKISLSGPMNISLAIMRQDQQSRSVS